MCQNGISDSSNMFYTGKKKAFSEIPNYISTSLVKFPVSIDTLCNFFIPFHEILLSFSAISKHYTFVPVYFKM
jgi:hypothetical protein